jgi:predicted Zn-dependent protease
MIGRTAPIIFCVWLCGLCLGQDEQLATKSAAARQAMMTGRYADAVKLYREMEAMSPEGTPQKTGLRVNIAIALEKTGRPAEAIPELNRVVRAQPDSAPAWFLLGLAYQQLGQPAKAIEPLKRSVALQKENAEAWLELGDAELAAGRPRDAVYSFQQLSAQRPDLAKSWQGLGLAYVALGERAFATLLDTAPDSSFAEALARHARNRDSPGISPEPEWFRNANWTSGLAAAEKSTSAENLYWAALSCEKLAEKQFAKLQAMPPTSELHELLAQSYGRLGRRGDAVTEWRTALSLRPDDSRLQGRLAEALVRDRKFDEAKQLVEPLAAAAPQNGEYQYLLGDILLEEKQERAALQYLEAAEKLLPEHLPAQEALGRAYLALGQPKNAVARLEKARPLDDGSISFALSVAYKRLGRDDDARAALARYKLLSKVEPH